MKNLSTILLFLILFQSLNFPQSSKTNWSLGLGGTYPRFVGITNPSFSSTTGYGGFISLKRNFSEHSGLRFSANYNLLQSDYDANGNPEIQKLHLIAGNLDYLYYFSPCETVNPYASFGFGGIIFTSKNSPNKTYDDTFLAYQLNLALGVEWQINNSFNLLTEFSHHTASTNDLDGRDDLANKGLFGSTADSYMKFNLGLVFYFSQGEQSNICDLYSGINKTQPQEIDYAKIEELVKKNIPKEEKKEVPVGLPVEPPVQHWVLVGVNFDLNSARLTKESYPILFYSFQVLQNNPEMEVEIQGYTDNTGSKEVNLNLSLRRAQTVKDYLVSKGIEADRLMVRGFGEENPLTENNTPEGRALNRRIEFKIIR